MICPRTRGTRRYVADGETVIAGSVGAQARELLTCLAGLEELAFERSVLAPQFTLTRDSRYTRGGGRFP